MSRVHVQIMWFHMGLPSDVFAKIIRLWRGGLLVSPMFGHVHASQESGCGRGTIRRRRGSTARWEGLL